MAPEKKHQLLMLIWVILFLCDKQSSENHILDKWNTVKMYCLERAETIIDR